MSSKSKENGIITVHLRRLIAFNRAWTIHIFQIHLKLIQFNYYFLSVLSMMPFSKCIKVVFKRCQQLALSGTKSEDCLRSKTPIALVSIVTIFIKHIISFWLYFLGICFKNFNKRGFKGLYKQLILQQLVSDYLSW